MAAAKRSSSSSKLASGPWHGLRSDCIATRAKGIYAAHCKEQQDAFWMKLGTEKRLAASAKRSLIPSAFNLLVGNSSYSNHLQSGVRLIIMTIKRETTPPVQSQPQVSNDGQGAH